MKIIVGRPLEGFVSSNVTSHEVMQATNSTVVMYLDSNADDRFTDYYKGIKAVLQNNNNSLLVLLDDLDPSLINCIVNLCLLYGCYNIYKLTDLAQLNKNYVAELLDRKPNREEVQMYVSVDSVVQDSMGECLLKLTELCKRGDEVGIADFTMENLEVLLQMPAVFDKLKSYEDPSNRVMPAEYTALQEELEKAKAELEDTIRKTAETNTKFEDHKKSMEQMGQDMKSQVAKIELLEGQNRSQQSEIEKLTEDNTRLQGQTAKGGAGKMALYTTLDTASISGSRAKVIIYFKEISRPKFFNSFINNLFKHIEKNKAVKMLIYDTKTDFSKLYDGLTVCSYDTFFSEQVNILSKDKLLVTDTNPAYLHKLFTSGEHEVYIIIDRLGKQDDLLSGHNVVKFYTFGSKSDYTNYIRNYKTLEPHTAILSLERNVSNVINIPLSDPSRPLNADLAKYTFYARIANDVIDDETSKKPIFNTILSKCGLWTK